MCYHLNVHFQGQRVNQKDGWATHANLKIKTVSGIEEQFDEKHFKQG